MRRSAVAASLLSIIACGSTDTRSEAGGGGSNLALYSGSASAQGSDAASSPGEASSSGSGASSSSGAGSAPVPTPAAPDSGFGAAYSGQYNLGPVDWQESQWHNACAPYPASVQAEEGDLLAGLDTQHIDGGRLCDSCVYIQAANGKSVIARVITYGTTGPNDIDVSTGVCTALAGTPDCDVFPRNMTWQFAECPDSGPIQYQFQTEASVWWTSFWVRNERMPLAKVEVKSQNHADWTALSWGTDGTLTDAGGFGAGPFSLRLTAADGQQVSDTFPSFDAGDLLTSSGQFQ